MNGEGQKRNDIRGDKADEERADEASTFSLEIELHDHAREIPRCVVSHSEVRGIALDGLRQAEIRDNEALDVHQLGGRGVFYIRDELQFR